MPDLPLLQRVLILVAAVLAVAALVLLIPFDMAREAASTLRQRADTDMGVRIARCVLRQASRTAASKSDPLRRRRLQQADRRLRP